MLKLLYLLNYHIQLTHSFTPKSDCMLLWSKYILVDVFWLIAYELR